MGLVRFRMGAVVPPRAGLERLAVTRIHPWIVAVDDKVNAAAVSRFGAGPVSRRRKAVFQSMPEEKRLRVELGKTGNSRRARAESYQAEWSAAPRPASGSRCAACFWPATC